MKGVLFGISVGFGYYPALSIVGHYFEKRRALAMGIVAAGTALGNTRTINPLHHLLTMKCRCRAASHHAQ